MKCDWKMYICNDNGEKFFGKGPMLLLHYIDEFHSINKAAAKMYMSYHKALNLLNAAEDGFGCKLVIKQTGGRQGGGTTLTEEAYEIINCYKNWEIEMLKSAEESFKESFSAYLEDNQHL